MGSEELNAMCVIQGCTNLAGCEAADESEEQHEDVCCNCFMFVDD